MLYESYGMVNGEERNEQTVSDQAANDEQICFETSCLRRPYLTIYALHVRNLHSGADTINKYSDSDPV
jgi:hypothetical protein